MLSIWPVNAMLKIITDSAAHVGYLLVDEGKKSLEQVIRGKELSALPPRKLLQKLKLLAYLGPITILSAAAMTRLFHAFVRRTCYRTVCFVRLRDPGRITMRNRGGQLVRFSHPQTPSPAPDGF